MERWLTHRCIHLQKDNIASNTTIYKHKEKFYIRATKRNTKSFFPFFYDGKEYSEVRSIGNTFWYLV